MIKLTMHYCTVTISLERNPRKVEASWNVHENMYVSIKRWLCFLDNSQKLQ